MQAPSQNTMATPVFILLFVFLDLFNTLTAILRYYLRLEAVLKAMYDKQSYLSYGKYLEFFTAVVDYQ